MAVCVKWGMEAQRFLEREGRYLMMRPNITSKICKEKFSATLAGGLSILSGVLLFSSAPSLEAAETRIRTSAAQAREGTPHSKLDPLLIEAVQRGDEPRTTQLLQQGADPNARDKDAAAMPYAMHYAAQSAAPTLMKTLLAYGAYADVTDKNNVTPLLSLASTQPPLSQEGEFYGEHCDARTAREEMGRLLLEEGANGRARTNEGQTVRDLAIGNGYTNLAAILP